MCYLIFPQTPVCVLIAMLAWGVLFLIIFIVAGKFKEKDLTRPEYTTRLALFLVIFCLVVVRLLGCE